MLESLSMLAEHGGELVVDNLDQLLRWGDRTQRRHADGLLLDALQELARQLEVYVSFEENSANLAESFLYVGISKDATATEARKRRFEFLGQLIEHSR